MTADRPNLFVYTDEAPSGDGPDAPRVVTEDEWRGDALNAAQLPAQGGRLRAALPAPLQLALAIRARRGDYAAVISYGERLAFPVALGLLLARRRPRHVAFLLWPLEPALASPLKRALKRTVYPWLARRRIDRCWVPSPRQAQLVVERWGLGRERLIDVGWGIDTAFWAPMTGTEELVGAAGREMRDYETLLTALEQLGLPAHVAAGTGVRHGAHGADDARARTGRARPLPPGVTYGELDFRALRELYARCRVVVVPLLPTDSDNGITTALEAMAMGKAVIATATKGRAAVLEDDVTCVLVPPEDPRALAAAIAGLWEDPARRARLGAAARERVLREHDLEHWLAAVLEAARG